MLVFEIITSFPIFNLGSLFAVYTGLLDNKFYEYSILQNGVEAWTMNEQGTWKSTACFRNVDIENM